MKISVSAMLVAGLVAATPCWAIFGETAPVKIDLDTAAKSQPPAATPSAGSKQSVAPSATKSANPNAAGKVKKAADKKEAPAKIEGMEIARGDRGYLGIKVENNVFKLSFYDAKKKPTAPDVARVALRWPVKYQPNDERTVLLPAGDGKSMTSGKVVRAPLSFKLFITLLGDDTSGQSPAAEDYVIDFRQ